MALPKLTQDLNFISALDDLPNDIGGMGASDLKAEFDKSGNTIKEYINDELVPQTEDAIAAAARGIAEDLKIGTSKIEDEAITEDKLKRTDGLEAVTTNAIRDKAVTSDKIADSTILGSNIANKAVKRANVDDRAIGKSQIDNGAVDTAQLANGAVTEDKLSTELQVKINKKPEKTDLAPSLQQEITGKQVKLKFIQITLESGQTSWEVAAAGVTETNNVIVSPTTNNDVTLWSNCRVSHTGQQGQDKLYFVAATAPSADISVNVMIID